MARCLYVSVDDDGERALKLTLKKDVPARKVWASLGKTRGVDARTHSLEVAGGPCAGAALPFRL